MALVSLIARETVPLNPSPDTLLLRLREEARAEALRLGFSRCACTTAEPLGDLVQRRWARWRGEGMAGAMKYLLREHPRRTHPRDLLPEAQSALVVLAGYHDGDHGAPPQDEGATGKIARYAWGRDYHDVLRERLTRLGEWIGERAAKMGIGSPFSFRPCVDSAPLDERALAARAGLGFIGKNTLLIDPQGGSWTLIGVLLVELELPPDEPISANRDGCREKANGGEDDYDYDDEVEDEHDGIHYVKTVMSCGDCRRCLEACPTGALSPAAPYQLDPRCCLSYLTIERKDALAPESIETMHRWAFGCDVCQEVCPFNARPLARLLPELAADQGAGPYLTEHRLAEIPTAKAFLRRWGHTPLARPTLKGLRRNLGVVSARPHGLSEK